MSPANAPGSGPGSRDREPMLAALAGSAERANRPTAVVVFCAAVLLVAMIFAVLSRGKAAQARTAYEHAASQLQTASSVAAEIKRITEERKNTTNAPGVFDPEPRLLSIVSGALTAAGLQTTEFRFDPPSKEEVPNSPLVRQVLTCRTLVPMEVEPVLDWVQRSLNAAPGLHVIHLSMKPTRQGWDITVKFARWELKS